MSLPKDILRNIISEYIEYDELKILESHVPGLYFNLNIRLYKFIITDFLFYSNRINIYGSVIMKMFLKVQYLIIVMVLRMENLSLGILILMVLFNINALIKMVNVRVRNLYFIQIVDNLFRESIKMVNVLK